MGSQTIASWFEGVKGSSYIGKVGSKALRVRVTLCARCGSNFMKQQHIQFAYHKWY